MPDCGRVSLSPSSSLGVIASVEPVAPYFESLS